MSSDEKLDELLRRMGLLETGISNLGKRMDVFESDLEALDNKFDEQFKGIRTELTERLREIDSNILKMNRKFDIVAKELLDVRAEVKDAQYRVDKLEEKAS